MLSNDRYIFVQKDFARLFMITICKRSRKGVWSVLGSFPSSDSRAPLATTPTQPRGRRALRNANGKTQILDSNTGKFSNKLEFINYLYPKQKGKRL